MSGALNAPVNCGTATATIVESIEFISTALTARTKKNVAEARRLVQPLESSGYDGFP